MNSPPCIGAMVLAAGSASRMGFPKQLLKIDGKSLVRRAAVAAIDAGCAPVVIVTGANHEAIAAELGGLPVQVAFNSSWSNGMGTSIRRGLAELLAIDAKLAAAVVLLSDQPLLDAAIVALLLHAWKTTGKPMAACEYSGTVGPPCCFAREKFDSLASLGDGDGAKGLLADPASRVTIPWPGGAEDVDTPEQWQTFSQNHPI